MQIGMKSGKAGLKVPSKEVAVPSNSSEMTMVQKDGPGFQNDSPRLQTL